MNKTLVILIVTFLAALNCSGQSFLNKYPKLTKKNLPKFFHDWKEYTDSLYPKITINNSVDSLIFLRNNLTMLGSIDLANYNPLRSRPRYVVYPREIEVYTYKQLGDTTLANQSFWAVMSKPYALQEFQVDTITNIIPDKGLCITDGISKKLETFIYHNGKKKANKRIKELEKYISIEYGVYNKDKFCNYPIITEISIASDVVVVNLILTPNTGREEWYKKKEDKLIRLYNNRGSNIQYD